MTSSQATKNTVSLLAGAGISALAIYLFNPREGAQRRERIRQAAGGVAKGTRDVLSSTWETAREKASQIGQAASAGTSSMGSSLTDVKHRISEGIGQLSGKVSGGRIAEQARRIQEETGGRIRGLISGREKQGRMGWWVNQTMLAIGCVGLGMGIMYILDPAAGKRRRAMARDRVRSSLGEMGTSVQKKSLDVWHRTAGLVTELRRRASYHPVDDSTLVERVRSEMGHCISKASLIHVSANFGRVTLRGPIEAAEVDALMKCVWSVPGVVDLISQLAVHPTEEAISDLPGEQTRSVSHS